MPKDSILSLKYLLSKASIWLHLFDLGSLHSDGQMKSKHTSMSIIHMKVMCFAEKKNFSWDKGKGNI